MAVIQSLFSFCYINLFFYKLFFPFSVTFFLNFPFNFLFLICLFFFLLCSTIFFNSFTSFFFLPGFHFYTLSSFLLSLLFFHSSSASLSFFLPCSLHSLSQHLFSLSPLINHSLLSFSIFLSLCLFVSRLFYTPPHYNSWYVRYAPGATLCRCRDPHLRFTRVYNTKPTCLECVTSRSVGASRRYGADIIGNRIQTLSFTQRTKKSGGRPTRRGGQTVHVDTCVRIEN